MTFVSFHIPAALPQPAQCYPFQPGEAVYYVNSAPYSVNYPNPPALVRAIVLEHQPAPVTGMKGDKRAHRIAILREDGRRSHVVGENLTYQGYCAFCAVPAVLDHEALICPKCNQPATAVPPPEELILRWYPLDCNWTATAVRACVVTGCSWSEGMSAWRDRHLATFDAMLDKYAMHGELYRREGPWTEDDGKFHWFSAIMHWYAELGDEASFIAYYRAHREDGLLPTERAQRLTSLFEHLDHIFGDDQPGPSRRMQLPPLNIPRIADDSEPDGACEITRWLDRQFGRAA